MYHQRHTEKVIMVTLTPNRIKDNKKTEIILTKTSI